MSTNILFFLPILGKIYLLPESWFRKNHASAFCLIAD